MQKLLRNNPLFNFKRIHKHNHCFFKKMETTDTKREEQEIEEKKAQEESKIEDVDKILNDILSISSECIQPDELRVKLLLKRKLICYDGFEPSGRMHIAQDKEGW
ncbi:hypothetical protein PFTANZ_00833 [Plasmodium falciparum Tanzania (2000708)]|uniref:tyrosine--tRNA ligase n=1 Tax=Plasmodium falciparum Tanzania (2000708) TaxID=1036725 RepID=A0A024WD44_PLAFA|nr:hypothetical protein PFTANZ_00833 [Plasmodium falciparum Tanzania (2000708)]